MKRIFMTALILLFGIGASFAQNTYFDILLNYTSTKFSYGSKSEALNDFKSNRDGLQAGISWQGGINDHFSIVPEFYYMMRGGKLKAGNSLSQQASKTRLHYFEMPFLARAHYKRFYLNAGPAVSFAMAGRTRIDGNENTPDQSFGLDFGNGSSEYRRWDAAIQFGGGLEFKAKKVRWAIDLRYHYGLVDINPDVEMYNRSFIVNLLVSKPFKNNPLAKKRELENQPD